MSIPADSFEAIRAAIDTSYSRTVSILYPGLADSTGYPARDGQRWQGLFRSSSGFEIRSFDARVRAVEGGPSDPPGGPYSARVLTTPFTTETDDPRRPDFEADLFFRRPGQPFADGPVITLFSGYWALYKGQLEFTLNDEYYVFRFARGPEDKRGHREPMLALSTSFGLQHLPSAGIDNGLLWVGDLDRDGRLDLLADEGWNSTTSVPTLYLSGEARDGEVVRRVARTSVCDC